ncbi:hypothetical protein C7E12_19430, partial [Stenotrophomonas maltophilia]
QQGMDPHAAGIATWQLGMAALVIMGVLKFVLSFFGEAVTRALPRAALLGSIAGIGMALLVLGPAFIAFKQQGMDPHAAGIATWQLGMAALVIMGVLKFVLSF